MDMAHDLFISYSRRDNTNGRVTQLVERVSRDFQQFSGRELRPFFDVKEIAGMEDWRHRILEGLRDSHLLLACLSPSYLQSEYCAWEFNEYLKHEVARSVVGDGVAPIYFVEVPGWSDTDFERRCAQWVIELRRRERFDLRPWFVHGEEALRDSYVRERMQNLNRELFARIQRGELSKDSPGNVDRHNLNFVGRTSELRLLREKVALGQKGVLACINGIGGMGKTSLAIEYAHAYAHLYPAGRWQVGCEGVEDLRTAFARLVGVRGLEFEYSSEEKKNLDLAFERVLSELKRRANTVEPHRVLVILDNVDRAGLLDPLQIKRVPAEDWLHIIATTQLGEADLYGGDKDRVFVGVDQLPEEDAIALIERCQPNRRLSGEAERQAARGIVQLLEGFTLAVETVAVFLGQFGPDVSVEAFLERLKTQGLAGVEEAAATTTAGVRHGEKSLAATLEPTLERLTDAEQAALGYGGMLDADHVALPWLRRALAASYPEFGRDAEPGYPDPWLMLVRRLLGLRLWQATAEPNVVRMRRLVQEIVVTRPKTWKGEWDGVMDQLLEAGNSFLHIEEWHERQRHQWEFDAFAAVALHWMNTRREEIKLLGAALAPFAGKGLIDLGRFSEAEGLLRKSLPLLEKPALPWARGHTYFLCICLLQLGILLTEKKQSDEAQTVIRRALELVKRGEFGHDELWVEIFLEKLGGALVQGGRPSEAEPLLRQALEIAERQGRKSTVALVYQAQVLAATGRLKEAEGLLRQCLDEQRRTKPHGGEEAKILVHLAGVLHDLRRAEEAEPLIRRALEIQERVLGPDHYLVAPTAHNLGAVLALLGRCAEAEPYVRGALKIEERTFGADAATVANGLRTLGAILVRQARIDEGEQALCRCIEILEAVQRKTGREDPALRSVRFELGVLQRLRFFKAHPRLAHAFLWLARVLVLGAAIFLWRLLMK
jgi:tetratricopeptide (TPR) repeat protein